MKQSLAEPVPPVAAVTPPVSPVSVSAVTVASEPVSVAVPVVAAVSVAVPVVAAVSVAVTTPAETEASGSSLMFLNNGKRRSMILTNAKGKPTLEIYRPPGGWLTAA
ncbi:hypothetical protein MSG28_010457 [Choristoneura fumiferana]|uniref:Uncharacterized protein n=1 Tax=Choristoneura fumiferana TaxID=7141 RepID=A0ACC0KLR4_CHOFU|nr:hypothetical protein MSG28_010457 [Choristoneura fumiferana]